MTYLGRGLLNCDPAVKIELKPDAEPHVTATPRRVPFPLLPKVEAELKRMLALGIIEHVTEPGAHPLSQQRKRIRTRTKCVSTSNA